MRALTDAELAALILEAVKAERAACAAAIRDALTGLRYLDGLSVAFSCHKAIMDRDLAGHSVGAGVARIDGAVSKPDTAQHETPTPN